MAWYLIIYLVVFVALGIAGIVEDRQSRRSGAFISGMAVALLVGILSVLAFAYPSLGNALGVWLWPLLAFAVSMEALSLVSDLRDLSREGETSRSQAVVIITVVAALTLPAYVLGAVAAAQPGS